MQKQKSLLFKHCCAAKEWSIIAIFNNPVLSYIHKYDS